jgi:hypothetical protein
MHKSLKKIQPRVPLLVLHNWPTPISFFLYKSNQAPLLFTSSSKTKRETKRKKKKEMRARETQSRGAPREGEIHRERKEEKNGLI